jgi:hypothetical protein
VARTRRPCCGEEQCPRIEISEILSPDDPLPDRVRRAARKVAEVCGAVHAAELQSCFSKIFDASPDCQLCDEFMLAYKLEWESQFNKQDIQENEPSGT